MRGGSRSFCSLGSLRRFLVAIQNDQIRTICGTIFHTCDWYSTLMAALQGSQVLPRASRRIKIHRPINIAFDATRSSVIIHAC